MRVLLVEDDKKTAAFIVKGLKEAGYAVDHCSDGRNGFVSASAYDYDVLVVDLMLPLMDGMSLIRSVRQLKKDVGIIILSAKHSTEEKVKGLQCGADDYLTKPFAFSELNARIMALLRRKSNAEAETTTLSFHDVEIHLLTREVYRAGKRIELLPKEFSLLEYFVRNARRVVTRTMILEHIWDINFDPTTNIVDVLVCRLREKIDGAGTERLIHTVRGAGYVFKTQG
jgi:two-component system OmpR family response regulator